MLAKSEQDDYSVQLGRANLLKLVNSNAASPASNQVLPHPPGHVFFSNRIGKSLVSSLPKTSNFLYSEDQYAGAFFAFKRGMGEVFMTDQYNEIFSINNQSRWGKSLCD